MMTLQSWRSIIPLELRNSYMNSKLWHSYNKEWVWELAVVDEAMIERIYKQLTEVQREVLLQLLDGLLLKPKLEDNLIQTLVRRLARPLQQCKQALQLLKEAGIVLVFQDPWRGLIVWMPLPVFNNWRHILCSESVRREHIEIPSSDSSCKYEHMVPLTVRFTMFLQQLNTVTLGLTKSGQLSKLSMKQLQQALEQYGGAAGIEQIWCNEWQGSGGIVHFMLELASNLGIAAIKQDRLLIDKEKLMNWLSLTQTRQDDLIWQWFMLQLLMTDISEELLVILLDLRRDERWYAFVIAEQQRPIMLRLLELFADCGYLSYSFSGQDTVYICCSKAAQPEYHLQIQNNGELILLPGIMPYVLWNSLELAEVESVQEVIMLKLTLQSLMRANYSVDRIRHWLQGHTTSALPIIIDQLLDMVQRTKHDQASELADRKSQQKGPDTDKIDLLQNEMDSNILFEMTSIRQWGVFCRNPLDQLKDAELISPLAVQQGYNHDAFDLTSLPRSWQHELRDYHVSTKQQIVEAAIELGLSINISMMKQSHKLVPFLLETSEEDSAVHALTYREPDQPPIRVLMKSIEAIQLVVE